MCRERVKFLCSLSNPLFGCNAPAKMFCICHHYPNLTRGRVFGGSKNPQNSFFSNPGSDKQATRSRMELDWTPSLERGAVSQIVLGLKSSPQGIVFHRARGFPLLGSPQAAGPLRARSSGRLRVDLGPRWSGAFLL